MYTVQIEKEYKEYEPYYKDFQDEVCIFVKKITSEEKSPSIDIADIRERTNESDGSKTTIKGLASIIKNIEERPEKYKGMTRLLNIKDIAGVRITCHCQSDRDALYNFLKGELNQKYSNVVGQQKDEPYRAYHLNFAKEIEIKKKKEKIYCEIQIRTVLGNAWALLDSKYLYKNKQNEGDSTILSSAISNILNSCESLWEIVKKKNKSDGGISVQLDKGISDIRERASKEVKTITAAGPKAMQGIISWFDESRKVREKVLNSLKINTFMEVRAYLPKAKIYIDEKITLKEAARKSTIRSFGWPIAIFMEKDEYRPKPNNVGIFAEVSIAHEDTSSYDYWSIRQDGAFYLLKSLFEHDRKPTHLFFNTRIVRITETLMYLSNLYKALGVDQKETIRIGLRYGGLRGKIMGATSSRMIFEDRTSGEDEVYTEINTSIAEINENMTDLVEAFTTPLFEIFDFFKVEREILDQIVTKYADEGVAS